VQGGVSLQLALYLLLKQGLSTMIEHWHENDYTISTDPQRLDLAMIHRFLSEESYWARGRSLEITRKALEHSLCFGLYYQEKQIGFGRVLTDYATFGYLLDVFILQPYRGQGLGKWLVQSILAHPALQPVPRWLLRTFDAHSLYAQYGFTPLHRPEATMELIRPVEENPYRRGHTDQ
jgi:GNAT superfamily N-acetyltransferase